MCLEPILILHCIQINSLVNSKKYFIVFFNMKENKLLKTISYRPGSESVLGFLEKASKEWGFTRTGTIELALKFLMEWPEEEMTKIIGNSISKERLHALVEGYVAASQRCDD